MMSVERAVAAFAGVMIVISVVLTQFVHEQFFWFTLFIGANLFQQSFSGFCPAASVMKKFFHIKTERELASESK